MHERFAALYDETGNVPSISFIESLLFKCKPPVSYSVHVRNRITAGLIFHNVCSIVSVLDLFPG